MSRHLSPTADNALASQLELAFEDNRLADRCPAVFVGMAGAIYASWVNYIEPPDVFEHNLAIIERVIVASAKKNAIPMSLMTKCRRSAKWT